MKLIRAMFLLLAVCLPASWTIAHAEDAPADKGGEMKKGKAKKKKAKKAAGDMGDSKKTDMK
ncbi:MAG: hypothetical protein JWM82_1690 [Myxococcales bacterium]|nr:hypothetical protein [Myxococcales bacterium]